MKSRAQIAFLAAVLAVALLVLFAGCGRKAKPQPRTASLAPICAQYDITLSR